MSTLCAAVFFFSKEEQVRGLILFRLTNKQPYHFHRTLFDLLFVVSDIRLPQENEYIIGLG